MDQHCGTCGTLLVTPHMYAPARTRPHTRERAAFRKGTATFRTSLQPVWRQRIVGRQTFRKTYREGSANVPHDGSSAGLFLWIWQAGQSRVPAELV